MTLQNYIYIYVIIINLTAFAAMGIDKSKAKRNAWRIPEATLFTLAIVGGSIGALSGMFIFHHKIRHLRFRIGLPLILLIHLFLVYVLFL